MVRLIRQRRGALIHKCSMKLDLYGRGYSDAPQTTYDVNLFTIQLALLMQYLQWDKAMIAGVSMVRGLRLRVHTSFDE